MILSSNYNFQTYNSLPSLAESNKIFKEQNGLQLLTELGKIFIKYKQYNKYGITLIHNHFGQADNEILVESMTNNKSITIPWNYESNPSPINQKFLEINNIPFRKKYIIPHTWKFNKNGVLEPYEFFLSDFKESEPDYYFINELYLMLKKYHVDIIFGLHLIHRNIDYIGIETTDEKNRANIFNFVKDINNQKDLVDVVWIFDNKENNVLAKCHCRCYNENGRHDHKCK